MTDEVPTTNQDLPYPGSGTLTSTKAVDLVDSIKSNKSVVPRGYSISQSVKSADALKELEEGTFNDKVTSVLKTVSMGGSVFDGFLLAASQEVGQSILTLPNVFSQTGFAGGILLELTFATLALYTNYLLVSMHAQHRHNLKESGNAKHLDPYHIVSYHEVRHQYWFAYHTMFYGMQVSSSQV